MQGRITGMHGRPVEATERREEKRREEKRRTKETL
jgi:hypothetical protein